MSAQGDREARRQLIIRYFPLWLLGGTLFLLFLPDLLTVGVRAGADLARRVPGVVLAAGETAFEVGEAIGEQAVEFGHQLDRAFQRSTPPEVAVQPVEIAPLFTQTVDHWAADISRWAAAQDLDPNLLATVMQIESCGHPTVSSIAGAQGLFQVMPFHFDAGEDQLDPNTNARRGAAFLRLCLDMADGDTGLAMACYNGGPSVLSQDMSQWYDEPRRYFYWGTGIYADAQNASPTSPRLDEWLAAGGDRLCELAANELRLN